MIIWLLILMCIVSYFIGNINFGRILSKAHNVDLTKKGSGNLGATNMLRNLGAKMGFLTLLLDALKGITTALAGYFVFGGTLDFPQNFISLNAGVYPDNLIGLYACGFSAVVGHVFPVIYGFKGGKGVATALGVFLVAQPVVTITAFIFCFVFVYFVKFVSLASLIFVSFSVVWTNIFLPEPNLVIALLTFGVFALTWFAHRANIERLLVGKENETNIAAKLKKDEKKQEREEIRQENKQEKQELREEKKEVRQEKKEVKKEIRQVKKNVKKRKSKGKKSTK